MFYLQQAAPKLWQGRFSSFPEKLVGHAVSTRFGGVTTGRFAALDLALHTGDDGAKVWENRQRFCAAMGLDAERIVTPQQVHGSKVMRVTEAEAGRGSRDYADALPETDALITDVPELPLLLCFADCVPLLFVDPVHQAVGAAHGGWRGTVAMIGQKTVQAMGQAFGSRPEDVLVGIGPSIGPCCFRVGDEVADRFRQAFPAYGDRLVQDWPDGSHVDLWAANRVQLQDIGVLPEHIETAAACTCCNPELFFSYRATAGRTGRIAEIIALKGKEEFI
jgi:YfiH family protein